MLRPILQVSTIFQPALYSMHRQCNTVCIKRDSLTRANERI